MIGCVMENKAVTIVETFRETKLKTKVVILFLLFLFILSLSSAEVYFAAFTPFGISTVFSMLTVGFSGYLLSAVFFISYMLSKFTVTSFIVAIPVSLVLCLSAYIKSRLARKNKVLKEYQVIILFIISLIGYIAVGVGDRKENMAMLISIVLSLIFLYISSRFCEAVFRKGIWVGLNLDEKICGAVIYLVFMIGALNLSIYYFNFGIILFSLSVLVFIYVNRFNSLIVMSIVAGVAFSLNYINPSYISLAVLLSIVGITFKSKYRIIPSLAVGLSYIIFVFVFNIGFSLVEVVSFSIGIIVFLLLPKKIMEMLARASSMGKEEVNATILNRVRSQLETRLKNLSTVFDDINKTYRDMVRGSLSDDKAIAMLKSELIARVCDSCPEKNNCYRLSNSFLDNSLDLVVSSGYERGKVLLTDMPQYLTSNCREVNKIITELNRLVVGYKEYAVSISNLDSSRLLIAEQLLAVSRLLNSLSLEVSEAIAFDARLEDKVVEELRFKGVMCIKASVYQRDITVKEIIIIVSNETVNDSIIEKCISKITAVNMDIIKKEPSSILGATAITLISSPKYDIAFAMSKINKKGKMVCGDSSNIIKIDYGKYLVSLTDGMGSGGRASKISNLTTKLIENFYRAGFDSGLILSTVNELLSMGEEENFSTIDLCIIDGRKCTYDFIKYASCNGYIIHDKGECEEIEGSNLPVGILENVKPHITKQLINNIHVVVEFLL